MKKTFLLSATIMSLALSVAFAQNTSSEQSSKRQYQTTTLSHDGKVQWKIDNRPDYVAPKKPVSTTPDKPVAKKKPKKKNTAKKVRKKTPVPDTAKKAPALPEKKEKTETAVKTPIKPPPKTAETKKISPKNTTNNSHKWKKPVLALDSGYSINDPGMAGVRGMREVEYNDRFVKELIPRIEAAGWEVKLTRGDYGYVSDKHRAAQANLWEADLLLSIHHDVSPKRFLKTETKDGVTVNQSTKSFEGYSMYVSKKNKKYRASLCFAQRLGFRLKPLQRDPAYFHKEHEGLPLLVKEYGIYERDIPLLRESEIPAVQVKIGVVTDPQDEAWINDDQYRRDIENAVIKTIRVFKQYCSYW